MRLSLRNRNPLKNILRAFLKISIRSLEVFPALGILRPFFFSSTNLVFRHRKSIPSGACPYEFSEPRTHQFSSVRIIEVTTFSEPGSARGIGNYLKRLFSDVSASSLNEVVFISFKRHDAFSTPSKSFLGRPIFYFDTRCMNCFTLLERLSQGAKKITFTSYFQENITPKYCSSLIEIIPISNVIVYDMIPKLNLLNFSNISRMRAYFAKSRLLPGTNLYPISRRTKAELETQGFKVKDVIKYKLTDANSSTFEKDKTILLFGSMNPRKNILRTVMAWDLIAHNLPEYTLTLVGHYSNVAKFLIRKILGSETNSICFTGEISDLGLDQLFQSASMLVAPSTEEGLGLPLIKALEFGTPVICANIDAYRELVSNKKSFFDPYSIHAISQALQRAITCPDEYISNMNSLTIGAVDFSELI